MKAIERHRQIWQGKSDEWIFERLDNELKQKVEEIHRLLAENEALRKANVSGSLPFADLLIWYSTADVPYGLTLNEVLARYGNDR